MGSLIKWFVFLLGLVGLGSSKKKTDSIKKTEAKKKQIKKKFTEENDDEAAKFLKDFASK